MSQQFDELLEQKYQFGLYQVKFFFIVSMIDVMDGFEATFLGILIKILQQEWGLSKNQVIALGSLYLLGEFIGNLLFAFFADKLGRKNTLVISCLASFVLILLCSLAQDYNQMIFLRILFGIIYGATFPLSHLLMSEVVPAVMRGRVMISLQFMYIIGKIYCGLMCMVFLEDFSSGDWRGFLRFNSIFILYCFTISFAFLHESPRFNLSKSRYTLTFRGLNEIGYTNHGDGNLYELIDWFQQQKSLLIESQQLSTQDEKPKFSELFENGLKGITIRLYLINGLIYAYECSLYLLIPFILHSSKKGFMSLIIVNIGELCSCVLVSFVIDSKVIGGRVKLLALMAFLLVISNLGVYLYKESVIVFGLFCLKFLSRTFRAILLTICTESFSTRLRSLGLGTASSIGQGFGVLSPLIMISLYYYQPYLPFLANTVICALVLLVVLTYPLDMTQRRLDTQQEVLKQKK